MSRGGAAEKEKGSGQKELIHVSLRCEYVVT